MRKIAGKNCQMHNVVSIKAVKTPVKDFMYGSERAGLAYYVISSTFFYNNLIKLIHCINSPTLSAYFRSSQSTKFPQTESQNVCPFGAVTLVSYWQQKDMLLDKSHKGSPASRCQNTSIAWLPHRLKVMAFNSTPRCIRHRDRDS